MLNGSIQNGRRVKIKKNSSFNIGIRYKDSQGWTAYQIYISNFIAAVKSLNEDVKFATISDPIEIDNMLFKHKIDFNVKLPNPFFLKKNVDGITGKVINKLWGFSEPYITDVMCERQGIDVVFGPSRSIPVKNHFVPWVSWIPDFQHLHLKDMFSANEIFARNQGFRKVALNADFVILSSQDTLRDFKYCFPDQIDKARVVPFVTQIPPQVFENNPLNICKIYNLPEKFFYLPNQFWMHKNHKIVIDAMKILHQSHPEIVVVCSGGVGDYRNQDYFGSLLNDVSRMNIRDNFLLLGFVPYEHVFTLIRQSIAVIQPSLFEGWSTTVEETKSMGKRVILSDISVHREQNPSGGSFFNPLDPDKLAELLVEVYTDSPPGPDIKMETNARAELPERTREFGRKILEVFKLAIRH